ncbi:MAG: sigma factor [Sphingobium sp.]
MDDIDQWFADQVLPLEGALTAYLRRVWPDPHEVADLRQEVYVRVYESGRVRRPPVTSFFVFTVARNLLTDRLRHARVVTICLVADLATLDIFSDEVPVDRALSGAPPFVCWEPKPRPPSMPTSKQFRFQCPNDDR